MRAAQSWGSSRVVGGTQRCNAGYAPKSTLAKQFLGDIQGAAGSSAGTRRYQLAVARRCSLLCRFVFGPAWKTGGA